MIFVDSSYLIALVDEADSWHRRALKVSKDLPAGGIISDYVLLEAVTIIGHRGGGKAGRDLYESLMDNFQVVYLDKDLLGGSMDVYLEYDGMLSVADAVSVEIMRRRGIKRVVSFDKDFDKVEGISRIG